MPTEHLRKFKKLSLLFFDTTIITHATSAWHKIIFINCFVVFVHPSKKLKIPKIFKNLYCAESGERWYFWKWNLAGIN